MVCRENDLCPAYEAEPGVVWVVVALPGIRPAFRAQADVDSRRSADPAELCPEAEVGVAAPRTHQDRIERVRVDGFRERPVLEAAAEPVGTSAGTMFRACRNGAPAVCTAVGELLEPYGAQEL